MSHGRGGLERTASPAAPAQRHPSGHLIEHPVQVTCGRAQIPRGWGARRETARRACDGAARVAGPRGACQIRVQTPQLSIHVPPLPSLGEVHTLSKKRTLTTGLSSQVPLATTSDLKQKHLISFLNPRKKRSGLPEVTKKWRTEDEAEAPAAEPPCNTASPCLFASKQLQNGKAWK